MRAPPGPARLRRRPSARNARCWAWRGSLAVGRRPLPPSRTLALQRRRPSPLRALAPGGAGLEHEIRYDNHAAAAHAVATMDEHSAARLALGVDELDLPPQPFKVRCRLGIADRLPAVRGAAITVVSF